VEEAGLLNTFSIVVKKKALEPDYLGFESWACYFLAVLFALGNFT
jgi:hypothetical protein